MPRYARFDGIWMTSTNMLTMYLQTRVPRGFHWRVITVLTGNPIVYMYVYQRCPQTLADICNKHGICDVFEAVAVMEIYIGFYRIDFFASKLYKISIYINLFFSPRVISHEWQLLRLVLILHEQLFCLPYSVTFNASLLLVNVIWIVWKSSGPTHIPIR